MLKAYYVLRTDLNMPASKFAVQVGHGTQYLMQNIDSQTLLYWMCESDSRKIICTCSSQEKLLNIMRKVMTSSKVLGCTIIEDSGYTFFKERTRTGIVFMTDTDLLTNPTDETALKTIKRLQLWKD